MADEIDAVHADWRPDARDDREAIYEAIERAAAENNGEVHIADVRPLIDRDVNPKTPGAVMCALVRAGVLVGTGQYRAGGNHRSRNRTRPHQVYYLTQPIPEEP